MTDQPSASDSGYCTSRTHGAIMSSAGENHDRAPAMEWRPGRLWSLWDMLQPYAHHALDIGRLIGTIITKLTGELAPENAAKIDAAIKERQYEGPLDSILISAMRLQLDRIRTLISKPITVDEALQACIECANRINDALVEEQFLHVPTAMAKLYNGPDLFGADVEAKFPQMSEDIAEAGKCLALNRSTAAVFHLMRIMEIAVQSFGDKLGVQFSAKKNWQNILDEINKSIKAVDQKAARTKAYAAAAAHLYNVKIAWRNEVMHPKQTYTPEESTKLFNAVGTFIRDLAGVV